VWDLLKVSLPEWKLPLQEWEKQLMEQQELEKKGEETTPSVSHSTVTNKAFSIFLPITEMGVGQNHSWACAPCTVGSFAPENIKCCIEFLNKQ
jgi:hypothetical protein